MTDDLETLERLLKNRDDAIDAVNLGIDPAFTDDDMHELIDVSVRMAPALLRAARELGEMKERVGSVLAANGCNCDCAHDSEGHDDDCDRCLACLVEAALSPAKEGG